jgi:hypothetical protein
MHRFQTLIFITFVAVCFAGPTWADDTCNPPKRLPRNVEECQAIDRKKLSEIAAAECTYLCSQFLAAPPSSLPGVHVIDIPTLQPGGLPGIHPGPSATISGAGR